MMGRYRRAWPVWGLELNLFVPASKNISSSPGGQGSRQKGVSSEKAWGPKGEEESGGGWQMTISG